MHLPSLAQECLPGLDFAGLVSLLCSLALRARLLCFALGKTLTPKTNRFLGLESVGSSQHLESSAFPLTPLHNGQHILPARWLGGQGVHLAPWQA